MKRTTTSEEYDRWAERFENTSGRKHLVKDKESAQTLVTAWIKAGGGQITPKMEQAIKNHLVPRILDDLHISGDKVTGDYQKPAPKSTKTFKVKSDGTHTYTYIGRSKGRIVYAREISTNRGVRFIDRKGRYVSLQKIRNAPANNKSVS